MDTSRRKVNQQQKHPSGFMDSCPRPRQIESLRRSIPGPPIDRATHPYIPNNTTGAFSIKGNRGPIGCRGGPWDVCGSAHFSSDDRLGARSRATAR